MDLTVMEIRAIASMAEDYDVHTIKLLAGLIVPIREKIEAAKAKYPTKQNVKAFISQIQAQRATGVDRHTFAEALASQSMIEYTPGEPKAYGVDPNKPGSGWGKASEWDVRGSELAAQAAKVSRLDVNAFTVTNLVPFEDLKRSQFLKDLICPINDLYQDITDKTYRFLLKTIFAFGGLADAQMSGPAVAEFAGLKNRASGTEICNELVKVGLMLYNSSSRKYTLYLASLEDGYGSERYGDTNLNADQTERDSNARDGWLAGAAPNPDADSPSLDEDGFDWSVRNVGEVPPWLHRKVARKTFSAMGNPKDYGRKYWLMALAMGSEYKSSLGVKILPGISPHLVAA